MTKNEKIKAHPLTWMKRLKDPNLSHSPLSEVQLLLCELIEEQIPMSTKLNSETLENAQVQNKNMKAPVSKT